MGKTRNKASKGVPNKHLHARISYLHQAATYLAFHRAGPAIQDDRPIDRILPYAMHCESLADALENTHNREHHGRVPLNVLSSRGLPLHLASHLRQVSSKSVIRISRDMKRAICKTCSTPLVAGHTSETRMENLSKGSRKPWADVLVITCASCGTPKRFPVGATRQQSKGERTKKQQDLASTDAAVESAVQQPVGEADMWMEDADADHDRETAPMSPEPHASEQQI